MILSNEAQNYIFNQQPYSTEIVPWMLYDRQMYVQDQTERLMFFQNTMGGAVPWGVGSNMQLPGCLPNPQAFLIESIRIYGVTSKIACAAVRLQIGNKIYGMYPAWTLALKMKGHKLNPNLFLAPMIHFQLVMEFERHYPSTIQRVWPIQVCMYGKIARPVQ